MFTLSAYSLFAMLKPHHCLGLQPSVYESRLGTLSALSDRHNTLSSTHSNRNPSVSVFNDLENLPRGSLLALVLSHALKTDPRHATRDSLKNEIALHLSSGRCLHREGLSSHLSCASIISQFDSGRLDETCDDPSTARQINILHQISPLLNLKPLRRLLELHDVSYMESDKSKKLRSRLKAYLKRLMMGKRPDRSLVEGSAKKERARESARSCTEWPQLVPESLKHRLLDNFGLLRIMFYGSQSPNQNGGVYFRFAATS
ncbi:hypothetical protein B0H17DRAFT_1139842 [Mycena rosella]|uniref:Uncharacterized protein n=1 Tax=Mycena rosella TaxID=1033263 RepID=A0AAD7D3E5_MYCRO|nr:hypothetical protein B0H17DRAFT_1139842 [Mycena rosella]